jgi:muramoyltetrapeptide carboxypeptidase
MIRKPAPLRRGDVIGVIAPAGAVEEEKLQIGVRILEGAGFRVELGAAARHKAGYLAGTDHERAADLHDMFANPTIKAIIAARGGYGSGRLLPLLDPDRVRQHPKVFVGHSDLTYLLTDLVQRVELVCFHGPMITGLDHRPQATDHLFAMLTGERVRWHQAAQAVIQPGTAEGRLVGGCLSVLVAMLGTPYALDTRGCLLFIEDVNEKPYRVDRMLTQLRQAGTLDDVAGVIFGEMSGCVATKNERVSVHDVVVEAFADATFPVAYGLPSGHGTGTLTLPFGIRARLAGERLTLLESPVVE